MDPCLQSSIFLQNKTMRLLSKSLHIWLHSPASESHPLLCAFMASIIILFLYFPHRFLSPLSALFSSLCLLLLFAFCYCGSPWPRLSDPPADFYELSVEKRSEGVPVEIIAQTCCSVLEREGEQELQEVNWELGWDEEEEGLIEIDIEEDNLFELDISAYG